MRISTLQELCCAQRSRHHVTGQQQQPATLPASAMLERAKVKFLWLSVIALQPQALSARSKELPLACWRTSRGAWQLRAVQLR